MTDWSAWHDAYDDPRSDLARRLAFVQSHVRDVLNSSDGPLRITSACAGDGRDVLHVLAGRPDTGRVSVTLIESDERNVGRAQDFAAREGLGHVAFRQADAGNTDAYSGAVPADLLLMCGLMGNIVDADIHTLIQALPGMCRPGSVVLWTRTREAPDFTGQIREWFAQNGFEEESFTAPGDMLCSIGRHRYTGEPRQLEPGQRLFTFVR